jgi:hypothetical protein
MAMVKSSCSCSGDHFFLFYLFLFSECVPAGWMAAQSAHALVAGNFSRFAPVN